MNIDTTVQEKAIAYPTDARLYLQDAVKLVRVAKSRDRASAELPAVGKESVCDAGAVCPCPADEAGYEGDEEAEDVPGKGNT